MSMDVSAETVPDGVFAPPSRGPVSEPDPMSGRMDDGLSQVQSRAAQGKVNSQAMQAEVEALAAARVEAILTARQKEAEMLIKAQVEKARQEAYLDALNQKKAELQACLDGVQQTMDELIARQEAFIEEYASELKYMAVDIAEKMLQEKLEAEDGILERLVFQNLRNVKNAQWITVELSEKLVRQVDAIKREIEQSEFGGKTNVVALPVQGDTCRVTTEEGTIVSTISVQAENLRRAFRESEQEDRAQGA